MKPIQDGDVLLFTHEDSVEPTGQNKYITNVALCFYSDIEKRYIPFSEGNREFEAGKMMIEDAEVVKICHAPINNH